MPRKFVIADYFLFVLAYTLGDEDFVNSSAHLRHQLEGEHGFIYEKGQRPLELEGIPTRVAVNIYINALGPFSETTMDYNVDCFLRQIWTDPRLYDLNRTQTITLDGSYENFIWTPDTFFTEAKDGYRHDVTKPNIQITVSPEGEIFYSQRLNVQVKCIMMLQRFPLDKQKCTLRLESYSHSSSAIEYHWLLPDDSTASVRLDSNIILPEFRIDKITIEDANATYPPHFYEYSSLRAHFYLTRHFQHYIIQTFVPSSLIVILSWVGFWIDASSTPARVSISLLAVLTMTTQFSGMQGVLPKVTYTKAIDVWMTSCLTFVFLALIEFAMVNSTARGMNKKQEKSKLNKILESLSQIIQTDASELQKKSFKHGNNIQLSDSSIFSMFDSKVMTDSQSTASTALPAYEENNIKEKTCCCASNRAAKLDQISRYVFPTAFITFQAIWWSYYYYFYE